MKSVFLGCIILWTASCFACGNEWTFQGHLQYQLSETIYESDDMDALSGHGIFTDHDIDCRWKAKKRWGRWDAEIHYELLALGGDSLNTTRALRAAGLPSWAARTGLPDDDRRLFDLTHEVVNQERLLAVHRLDRLSLGYSSEHMVVRAGRYAVSWGNGLVFNPLDIFNPFSPTAVHKDYKTGDDMFYGQWVFDQGDDIQAIIVPRRDPTSSCAEDTQGSMAFKYHGIKGGFDYDLLAARHYDNTLAGIGLAKDWRGAIWRFDISVSERHEDGRATWFVTNLDRSWTWGDHNVYTYVEYFRNGVGEANKNYTKLKTDLQERIARGELFTLGRDFLTAGVQIELTPLLQLHTSMIWNLNDGSLFCQLRATYDWTENTMITGGINLPYGSKGTEFSGSFSEAPHYFPVPDGEGYVRLSYFF